MGAGPTPTTIARAPSRARTRQALRMRDSSMFYFNISINHCMGSKWSPQFPYIFSRLQVEPAPDLYFITWHKLKNLFARS